MELLACLVPDPDSLDKGPQIHLKQDQKQKASVNLDFLSDAWIGYGHGS
jgi:hypothetical protein